jgi:hypothetical protein
VNGRIDFSPPYTNFWTVDFQKEWSKPTIWIQHLKPMHDFIDEATNRIARPPKAIDNGIDWGASIRRGLGCKDILSDHDSYKLLSGFKKHQISLVSSEQE